MKPGFIQVATAGSDEGCSWSFVPSAPRPGFVSCSTRFSSLQEKPNSFRLSGVLNLDCPAGLAAGREERGMWRRWPSGLRGMWLDSQGLKAEACTLFSHDPGRWQVLSRGGWQVFGIRMLSSSFGNCSQVFYGHTGPRVWGSCEWVLWGLHGWHLRGSPAGLRSKAPARCSGLHRTLWALKEGDVLADNNWHDMSHSPGASLRVR